jgi:radical SAM superfamily enzyme YgiQ (UPF0313 family)
MSNLGLQILYDLVNAQSWALADRAYAPWVDMEAELRRSGSLLNGLETGKPLSAFDVVGFSLSHELSYSNVLNMLELGGISLRSARRDDGQPLVIAGGTGASNPEPMAMFIDLFVIGEAERALLEVLAAYRDCGWRVGSGAGMGRIGFLKAAASIPGVYVPALHAGWGREMVGKPSAGSTSSMPAPAVSRRIVEPLPAMLTSPVVPFVETVHDRATIEIQRGCARGCRFCQAGFVYRPVRRRTEEEILAGARTLLSCTGYEELGLLSLSATDYPDIDRLMARLARAHPEVNISLPSLRIDSFSVAVASAAQRH